MTQSTVPYNFVQIFILRTEKKSLFITANIAAIMGQL